MNEGLDRPDRTGTGTRGIFGAQMRFDLSKGFPFLTTKKMNLKAVICELLWFLKGSTNIKYLNDNGVHIWDEWANKDGELGPVYGKQWRKWDYWTYSGDPNDSPKEFEIEHIDQIANVIESIKTDPYSRRHIVSAWNVADIDKMALPPCHLLFQFYVSDGKLSCQMDQRSCDMFLGVPFNIASYSLLTMMIALVCNLQPGEFIHILGDAHIYRNHFEQVTFQMTRIPRVLPKMCINPDVKNIDNFKYEDFELIGYDPYPAIKGVISV